MGDVNIVGAIIKVALVFGLLWVTLRVVARLNGPKMGGAVGRRRDPVARPVEVLGRSPLGRSASVSVVRLGDRCFALGVTEQNVNLLTEVDIDLTEPPDAPPVVSPISSPIPARTQVPGARPTWRDFVESLRERTVRH
jgi:flagellar biogenesis protein FliO